MLLRLLFRLCPAFPIVIVSTMPGLTDALTYRGAKGAAASVPSVANESGRIRIAFESRSANGLAVDLKPDYPSITVKPGEPARLYFFLTNRSGETVTVRPSYIVLPRPAAVFYNQVQNLCAADPTLKVGETIQLWQDFYIDPEITRTPDADPFGGLTVSYTISEVDRTGSAR